MDVNIYSDSAWNSASFGIIFKSAKNVHEFFLEATIAPLWPKLLKCCLYLAVFTTIAQFYSKINNILGIRTKICIDSDSLYWNNFFTKNRPVVPLRTFLAKIFAVVPSRSIFRENIFHSKENCMNAIFCADSKYAVYFAINLSYSGKNCQI